MTRTAAHATTLAAAARSFRDAFEAARQPRYTVRAWGRDESFPVMPPTVAFADDPGSDEHEHEARALIRVLSETLPRQDRHAVARVYPHQLGTEIGVALAGITFHFAGDRAHEPATFAFAEACTDLIRDALADLERGIVLDEQQSHESSSCCDEAGCSGDSSSDADAITSATGHGMRNTRRAGVSVLRSFLPGRVAARIARAATRATRPGTVNLSPSETAAVRAVEEFLRHARRDGRSS